MTTVAILAVALVVYVCRLSGFLVGNIRLTGYWERFFWLLPSAVFAALVMTSLLRIQALHAGQALALVSAGMVAWRTRQVGLSVLVGLATLWAMTIMGAA